jgi:hypothetical protein
MTAARSKSFAGMEVERKASLEQNAREKMMAGSGVNSYPSATTFMSSPKIAGSS